MRAHLHKRGRRLGAGAAWGDVKRRGRTRWDAPGSAGSLSEPSPSREGSVPSPICLPVPPFLSVGSPATRWSAMEGDGDGGGSQGKRPSAAEKKKKLSERRERFKSVVVGFGWGGWVGW